MAPGRDDLAAAAGGHVDDLVAPDLAVLFCGINPGLWSAAVGAHFARPGNRFWRVLHESGFTDRLLRPTEQRVLPSMGIGITNLVPRSTARADELTTDELRGGVRSLERRVTRLHPRFVAFLGLQAFRTAFVKPGAAPGRQPDPLAGSTVWLLPNPSGLQARYQLPELVELFGDLRRAVSSR